MLLLASSGLHHINLVDENSCSSTLNLSLPQVIQGGEQEDCTTAMTEGEQQDDAVAGRGAYLEFIRMPRCPHLLENYISMNSIWRDQEYDLLDAIWRIHQL